MASNEYPPPEPDLYGVSDDENDDHHDDETISSLKSDEDYSPASGADSFAANLDLSSFPFLRLPVEIRKMVYLEILAANNVEFFLHVDSALYCGEPLVQPQGTSLRDRCDRENLARICILHRPQDGIEAEEMQCAPGEETTYLKSLGLTFHDDDLIRHHQQQRWPYHRAFLNLLATCKQTREEISSYFWHRTQLHVGFEYGVTSSKVGSRLVFSLFQGQRAVEYAGYVIGEHIQKLSIEFHMILPKDISGSGDSTLKARYDEILEAANKMLETLLTIFPKLRVIEFCIKDMKFFDALVVHGMIKTACETLRHLKDQLSSIDFRGKITNRVLEEWKLKFGPKVAVARSSWPYSQHWPGCLHTEYYTREYRSSAAPKDVDERPDPILAQLGLDFPVCNRFEILAQAIRLLLLMGEQHEGAEYPFFDLDRWSALGVAVLVVAGRARRTATEETQANE